MTRDFIINAIHNQVSQDDIKKYLDFIINPGNIEMIYNILNSDLFIGIDDVNLRTYLRTLYIYLLYKEILPLYNNIPTDILELLEPLSLIELGYILPNNPNFNEVINRDVPSEEMLIDIIPKLSFYRNNNYKNISNVENELNRIIGETGDYKSIIFIDKYSYDILFDNIGYFKVISSYREDNTIPYYLYNKIEILSGQDISYVVNGETKTLAIEKLLNTNYYSVLRSLYIDKDSGIIGTAKSILKTWGKIIARTINYKRK